MKINDIKALVVNAQLRNWVLVKVESGVPGLYGWGEERWDGKLLPPPAAWPTSSPSCWAKTRRALSSSGRSCIVTSSGGWE